MSSSHSRDQLSDVLQSLKRLEDLGKSILAAVDAAGGNRAPTKIEKSVQPLQRPCEKDTDVGDCQTDILNEDVLNFGGAAKLVPWPTPPHPATLSRWSTSGINGIFLESAFVAGRRVTSKQAVGRFLAACRDRGFAGMAMYNAHWLEKAMAAKEQLSERPQQRGTDSENRDRAPAPPRPRAKRKQSKL